MDSQTLTVAEYNRLLNTVLANVGEFAIEGELTSMKMSRNGALFAELKDLKENALLQLSNYGPRVEGLNSIAEGMQVRVYGYSEIYSPYGKLSFKPRKIEPVGEGALRIAFEKLKASLETEGLFSIERKRPLPTLITRIALLTGKDSAAFADFTKILAEHNHGIEIDYYPVLVQGESSEREIERALTYVQKTQAEVVVLVRGGGSLEDLKSFNSERVARAIFNSRLPVVVGVGHEVDTSIADLVADLRASTPSQAAYYLASINNSVLEKLSQTLLDLEARVVGTYPDPHYLEQILQQVQLRLLQSLPSEQLVENMLAGVEYQLSCILPNQAQVNQAFQSLGLGLNILQRQCQLDRFSAEKYLELLTAYNPEKTLERGYALVSKDGKYLANRDQLAVGDKVSLRFSNGQALSQIIDLT